MADKRIYGPVREVKSRHANKCNIKYKSTELKKKVCGHSKREMGLMEDGEDLRRLIVR